MAKIMGVLLTYDQILANAITCQTLPAQVKPWQQLKSTFEC